MEKETIYILRISDPFAPPQDNQVLFFRNRDDAVEYAARDCDHAGWDAEEARESLMNEGEYVTLESAYEILTDILR